MKKLVISLALALLCMAAFAGCAPEVPEPPKHELTKVEAVSATCVQKGSVEYWHCAECNKDYKDADETAEITEEEKVTPALGHNYGELIAEVSPTCTENGVRAHFHCDRCDKNFVKSGNKYIERKDLTLVASHTLGDLVPATAPTCAKDGNAAYYSCSVCQENLAEDKTTVLASVVIPKVGHDYQRVIVSPTFTAEGKDCTICKYCFEAKPGTTEVILNKREPIDTTSIVSTSFTDNGTRLVKISVTATKAGWYRVVLDGEPPRAGTYDGCMLYNEAVQGIGFASGQRQPKEASGTVQPYYVWLNVGDNTLVYRRGSTASDAGKDQNGADLGYTTPNVTLTKATLAMVATEEIEVGLVLMDAQKTGLLPGQISATGSFGTLYTTAARNDFKPTNGVIRYENVEIDAAGYYFLFGMLLNYYGDNLFEIKFTKAGATEPFTVHTNDLKYDNIGKTGDVIEGSLVARKLMELGIVCLEAGTYTVEVRNAGAEDAKFLLGGLFLSLNTSMVCSGGHTAGELIAEVPSTCSTAGVAAHKACITCGTLLNAEGTAVVTAEELAIPANLCSYVFTLVEPTSEQDGSAAWLCAGCDTVKPGTTAVTLKARGTLDTTPIEVTEPTSFTPDSVNGLIEIAVNNVAKAGWYRVLPFGDAKLEDSTKDATFMYNKTLQGLGLASAQAHKVDNANTTAALERPYYVYLAEGNNVIVYKRGTPALATVPALPTLTKVTFTMVATEGIDVGLVLGDALSGQFTGSLNNNAYVTGNPSVVNAHHWFKMTDKAITYENVTIAESGYYYVLGMMRSGGVNAGYKNEFRIDFTKTGEEVPCASLGGDVIEAQDAVTPSETTNGSYNGRKLAEMGYLYLEAGTYTVSFSNASHADSNAKIIIGGLFLSLNTACTIASEE